MKDTYETKVIKTDESIKKTKKTAKTSTKRTFSFGNGQKIEAENLQEAIIKLKETNK